MHMEKGKNGEIRRVRDKTKKKHRSYRRLGYQAIHSVQPLSKPILQ